MSQPINPWKMAIENWMDRVRDGAHCAAFRDAWMRLDALSTVDLTFTPKDLGLSQGWIILALHMTSFDKQVGEFTFAVRDASVASDKTVLFCAPKFSANTNEDLRHATLSCLYNLAPSHSELSVVLEDDIVSSTSTLAAAGQYTEAGWIMDPEHTELVSEQPRRWIFRFKKSE